MKKKYISLMTFGSILIISAGVGLGVGLSNHKSNSQNTNITSLNNANYYNANGFLLSMPSSSVTIGNITYSLDTSNNTATIINTTNNLGNFKDPGIIQNNNTFYKVTAIGQGACYNKGITSLSLPNTIKVIGADAFANNLLTTLTLPPYLTTLGNNAFSNNPFKQGTVINLPSNCSWNKTASLAPFNNNNNMGNFARCVKYIIQNLAVYGYVYGGNRWQVVSWMPQVQNLYNNAVSSDDYVFNKPSNSNSITQRRTSPDFSASVPFTSNASLQDTAIISYSGRTIYQAYGFKTIANSNNLTFYWTNPFYNDNGQFTLNLYNPDTLQELYSNDNDNYIKNSLLINYGDVIGIRDTIGNSIWNSGGNCVLSNGLPANEINGNTLSECGLSLGFKDSYLSQHNEMNYYVITKQGLIPYENVLHVNINCLQDTTNTFNLTGTALANHDVIALIDGQIYYGISNDQGYFSIPVTVSSPLDLGTKIQVDCEGCLPYNGYLLGANPINSGLLFQFDGANFGILPDGYTGTYQLWNNSSSTMPNFNDPYTSSYNSGYNPNSNIIPKSHPIQMTLTDTYINAQNKTISSTVNIDEAVSTSSCTTQIEQELQNLKFNPNFNNTLTLTINPDSGNNLYKAIFNGNCIPINYSDNSNGYNYTFTVNMNSFYAPNSNTWTGGSSFWSGYYGRGCSWAARNFCLVSNWTGYSDGTLEDDFNASNGLTPSAAMWQKVKEITAHCESTYQKAVAINEWVTHNMVYTYSYTYYHTIVQTFNHLQGVCGNYAALAAVMCMMAGLVSRVVVGWCDTPPNYFSFSSIDHAWMQVWDEQLGGWVTLDPTWGIYGPYGTVQDTFNVFRSNEHIALVLWPKGTNYFSYFAGHSYAALLNLGNYFGYSGGELGTFYPMRNAAYISQLLHQSTALNGTEADIVSY